MDLSENERLLLVKKKERIFKITSELMTKEMTILETKSKINEIVSLLSTIECYAKTNRVLSAFTHVALEINTMFLDNSFRPTKMISAFCIAANSVKFDFTKNGLSISMPLKLEAILNKNQFG
jgi:hypothetical protein